MADKAEKKKQKKQGTISQIIQIFKYTQAEDRRFPWLCGGVFVAPIIVFVVLGVIFKWHVFSWILFMILAVMLGVLFATMMLTKRADKVGYAKIEGRPGAAVSVLGNISKAGFNFPQEPVWIDPKTKDAIWRGTGYNGIYLLGEGDYNRVNASHGSSGAARIKGRDRRLLKSRSTVCTSAPAQTRPASRTCARRCSSSRATSRPITRTS